jgi:hypothetical protein
VFLIVLFSFFFLTQESSTQKLLFHKDVAEYRKSVKTFFLKVEMVNDKEFWRAMDDNIIMSLDFPFVRLFGVR